MKYESPKIIKEYPIKIEDSLLSGSIVSENSEVTSTGQEVETYTIDTFDADGNSLWY